MKKVLIFLLKIAVVAGAFVYLVSRGHLSGADFLKSLSHPGYIALAMFLAFLPMIISYYRHWVLLRALGIRDYPLRETARIGFIGSFFSTFMPSAMGGDVIKTGYLIHATRQNAKAIASVLIDRVQGLFGLLLVGGLAMVVSCSEVLATPSLHKMAVAVFSIIGVVVCAAFTGLLAMLKGRKLALGAWLLLCVLGLFGAWKLYADGGCVFQFIRQPEEPLTAELATVLLRGRFIVAIGGCLLAGLLSLLLLPSCQPGHRLAGLVTKYCPGGKQLMALTDSVLLFHNNIPALFYTLFMSLLTHGFNLLSVYFCGLAVELATPPTVFSVFFASPMAFIANCLPMPGGGLGVGEAVFAEVLALCRTESGAAIVGGATVFLTWRIWWGMLCFVCGLPCYLAGKKEIASLREEIASGDIAPELAPARADVGPAAASQPPELPHA